MLYFNNDYSEGCHEAILEALARTNYDQTPGYGEDAFCARAAEKIRDLCGCSDCGVHFLVGGTQANFTVIAAALRPYQGVLCADSAHIHVHETGAVEGTGHKCLALPAREGKITGEQVREAVLAHRNDPSFEHTVQPAMVYISQSTELGTLYSRRELEDLSNTCRELGLYLFLDGARLGYALAAEGNDLTLSEIARLCDVFYIGGTKVGALFGEAVVIPNPEINRDFRYMIKHQGGMLAKGRLLGLQFLTLFSNNLYFEISQHAVAQAMRIREAFAKRGIEFLVDSPTNQQFPILTDKQIEVLSRQFLFSIWTRIDTHRTAVRFCTSWGTCVEAVDQLVAAIENL